MKEYEKSPYPLHSNNDPYYMDEKKTWITRIHEFGRYFKNMY